MSNTAVETAIGAAVLAVAAGFLTYAYQSRGLDGNAGLHEMVAEFSSVEGIGSGSEVRLAGIRVGTVVALELDPRTYTVDARFTVRDDLALPEDTEVSVASEGLLGGAFLELRAGESEFRLGDGDRLYKTRSGESLLNQIIQLGISR